ncbi:hypothetical protein PV325_007068 [Microctonus aethiopoides]|nr:hypothetical protein PV325_007068 [Microctonus aethiopoides]
MQPDENTKLHNLLYCISENSSMVLLVLVTPYIQGQDCFHTTRSRTVSHPEIRLGHDYRQCKRNVLQELYTILVENNLTGSLDATNPRFNETRIRLLKQINPFLSQTKSKLATSDANDTVLPEVYFLINVMIS